MKRNPLSAGPEPRLWSSEAPARARSTDVAIKPAAPSLRSSVVGLGEEPRVLDLRAGAKYLGISYWSLRDLVLGGHVPAVRLPCPRAQNGRIMRRLLVDRRDLDDLIERSRERHD